MAELHTVMYDNKNLYSLLMNKEESLIIDDFRKELIDICDNLKIPTQKHIDGSPSQSRLKDNHDFCIKYKKGLGYFALCGERGMFSIQKGFPTADRNEAKLILLEDEFSRGGFQYELDLRSFFKKEWGGKYRVEYDFRKAAFEYSIIMLRTVFESIPDRIISYYTDCMNKWFNKAHWYFDENKLCFKEL